MEFSSTPQIVIIGAGPVGTAIALEAASQGVDVTILAQELPGEGATGDNAAGIGCIFKPSSELVANMVLSSYNDWMKLANDPFCPAVTKTQLHAVVDEEAELPWSTQVENFSRLDSRHVRYDTYSFDPVALGQWRINQFSQRGGAIRHRPLYAREAKALLNKSPLPAYDYTVVTMGLRLRDIRPELGLFPIRGLLVHLPKIADKRSFMDEAAASYVVSRPDGLVAGGTFEEGIGTCTEFELVTIGEQITDDASRRFGIPLDFDSRTRITVCYRPGKNGDPILEFNDQWAVVNGLGGQGWITGPELARTVVRRIMEILAARASV